MSCRTSSLPASLASSVAPPGIAASLIAISFTSIAFADVEYDLYIIEPWNQDYALASSSAAGINDQNVVTGCAHTDPLGLPCSFRWTPESGKVSIELAGPINDAGEVVSGNAIRRADGTIELLPVPFGSAADINDMGVVVGSTGTIHTCPKHPVREAVVWDPVNGVRRFSADFGVATSDQAWSINEQSELVGVRSTTGHCGDQEAFYFDLETGTHIDIHAALVGSAGGVTRAHDINNAGMVVGDGPHEGTVKPFVWSNVDGFSFLPPPPGAASIDTEFRSINDAGRAVGRALMPDFSSRAIVWTADAGTRDLNELVDLPGDFVIDQATMINANGWIIGSGHTGSWSPARAVVLVPRTAASPGDVNADGQVDFDDLLDLLAAWGPCSGCPEDLDNSDAVDFSDLLIVLAGWT